MNRKKRLSLILMTSISYLLPVSVIAQEKEISFASFEIDSPLPRTDDRIRGVSQRLPLAYHGQADMIENKVTARIKRDFDYKLELGTNLGSGSYAPFWLTSNKQGFASVDTKSGYMRMSANGGMDLHSGFFVDGGIDVSINANYQSGYYIRQFYLDIGYKWIDFSFGTKERWGELKNIDLSSGALTWSGNSQPVPQIRLELPEYVRMNIFGRWFSVKGHVSYGKFTDSEWRGDQAKKVNQALPHYTDKILYHSKAAFLKFGDVSRFPLEITLGLEMNAMFGGGVHNFKENGVIREYYKLPNAFDAYWEVFMPFNQPGEQGDENGDNLGSWHLAFDLTLDRWKARAYYEHYYEDHSSMLGVEYKNTLQGDEKQFVFYGFKRNWFDGLFGLELTAPDGLPFRNIVLEFMNTRSQCGSICNFPNKAIMEEVSGRDNMYEHSIYQSYQHWGYACGNPVLISPVYNKDGNLKFQSNRVMMFHVGVNGNLSNRIDYRLLVTHTHHWGTYDTPLKEIEKITSLMLECNYSFGDTYGWRVGLSGAMDSDSGNMLGDNRGIMIKVSKIWDVL